MSEHGLARLRAHEAFEPEPYDDGAGNATVGYGHMVLPHEDFSEGLTEAQARDLFAKDVDRVVHPALDKIKVHLTQNQIDALGSFIYNVGPGTFEKHVLPIVNAGVPDQVTAEMDDYVTGKDQRTGERTTLRGLVRRRREEIALFHSRVNPAPPAPPEEEGSAAIPNPRRRPEG
jgi:GH24 family phage-related lysozyme (muramidase)